MFGRDCRNTQVTELAHLLAPISALICQCVLVSSLESLWLAQ